MQTVTDTSPFVEHLDTNWIPSRIDRQNIQHFLERPRAQLDLVVNEVTGLQDKLDKLTAERDKLRRLIHDHHNLLSPMRGLPDDILREIFQFCMPTDYNAIMSASEAPLLLGRVCARWRAIAYRTPRLWASLHIPIPTPPAQTLSPHPLHVVAKVKAEFTQKVQNHCAFIEKWLDRSGSCPISFSFHPRDHTVSNTSTHLHLYFNLLLKYLHRWGSVEMTIPIGFISTALANITPQDVPALFAADLRFTRRHPHDEEWKSGGLLRSTKLTWIRLTSFPLLLNQTEIAWSNISQSIISEGTHSTRVRRVSLREAYHLMSRCPRLLHCSIDVFSPYNSEGFPQLEPVSLPKLEVLTVNDGIISLGALFECLEVPVLHTITYHPAIVPSYRRRSPLASLLARTQGTVETVTTDIGFYTLTDLIDCFESAPSIKHFIAKRARLSPSREQTRLRSYLPLPFPKVFLRLLTLSSEGPVYLPNLETLTMREGVALDDDLVYNFVASRNGPDAPEGVRPLKKLSIKFCHEQQGDIYERLSPFVAKGLVLEFDYWERKLPTAVQNFSPWNGVNRWAL